MDKLKRFLQTTLGSKVDQQSIKQTPYTLQVKYDDRIDVDLLVSPFWAKPSELYQFLREVPESNRIRLVRPYQINFVFCSNQRTR